MSIQGFKLVFMVILPFLVMACSRSQAAAPAGEIDLSKVPIGGAVTEAVVVQQENLFPEGIEYDPVSGRFLLSSLAEGTVFAVEADGAARPLIQDEVLIASVGLEVDAERNRLLAVNTEPKAGDNPDIAPQAFLAIYDLATGERLQLADLLAVAPEGKHVVNDVAIDSAGNAYVTDSAAPILYKVEPDGQASVFATKDMLTDAPGNLNGIVYHPNGYLLVAKPRNGILLKIPLDNPEATTQVNLDQPIPGADGMVWQPNGNLVVVSGRLSLVFSLHSADEWVSAKIEKAVKTGQPATTAAIRDNDVFVIYGHLDQLDQAASPVKKFEIVQIKFD